MWYNIYVLIYIVHSKFYMKEGKLTKGMKVLSIAQGLGYTWGGMVLRF